MDFSINEWLRIYNKVQMLGKVLKDSYFTYDNLKKAVPPKVELSKDEQLNLESRIKTLTERSNHYLDQCGLKCAVPLWHYNNKDPRTWVSHESFMFEHLRTF
jgi:hypothetical protein